MVQNIDEMRKLGNDSLDASVKSFGALANSAQLIASEMANYSKKSFEEGGKAMEKLLGAKTVEQAVQVQADFAKNAYEDFVAGLTKISELYADLAKETYKSFEPYVAKDVSTK
jgi:hypothetical protein